MNNNQKKFFSIFNFVKDSMKIYGDEDILPLFKKYLPSTSPLLKPDYIENILAVSKMFNFRATSHVVDNLINWKDVPNDPVFNLVFPQEKMLKPELIEKIKQIKKTTSNPKQLKKKLLEVASILNPHPASQHKNVPSEIQLNPKTKKPEIQYIFDSKKNKLVPKKLSGLQHKYDATVLIFPKKGQFCFSYCSYCFRWGQWASDLTFECDEYKDLFNYLSFRPNVTDILVTGGDPPIMHAEEFEKLLFPFIEGPYAKKLNHVNDIRIGTKSLSFWPNRWVNQSDSNRILKCFEKVNKTDKKIAIMAHISHPNELQPQITHKAIQNLLNVGCIIRSQSPIVNHVNNNAKAWEEKWKKEVSLGIIPYYMFMERDTGPKQFFEIPIEEALTIYNEATSNLTGLAKTARGPSMSCTPGKIKVVGIDTLNNEKVFILQFLQGRSKEWTKRLFYAKYDPKATWIDQLKPAFGEKKFFYEDELEEWLDDKKSHWTD